MENRIGIAYSDFSVILYFKTVQTVRNLCNFAELMTENKFLSKISENGREIIC